MKADIHPEYVETTVACACGVTYTTRSTKPNMRIGICAACHPFYTGQQKFVDTAGRVDRFKSRYGSTSAQEAISIQKAKLAEKKEKVAQEKAQASAKKKKKK